MSANRGLGPGGGATGGAPGSDGRGTPLAFEFEISMTPTPQRSYPQHLQRPQHYPQCSGSQVSQYPQYQQSPRPQYPAQQPQQYYQQQPYTPQNQHAHHTQQYGQPRTPSQQHHDHQAPRRPVPSQSHLQTAAPHTPGPQQHTHEHSLLLISLAESYFENAHHIGANAAAGKGNDACLYYKLMATGLACLESILLPQKGKTIQARLEALVRLRYAAVLFEETDNLREAETVLLKGIITASRNNNLLDLNFSMQHLLVRIMFQMNPKAALIQLQKYTKEAEERGNPLWAYAFRFLRCSLLLENSPSRDVQLALHSLQKIATISQRRNDMSVFMLSSLTESMISLHLGPEGIETTQRALARVNSMQLEEAVSIEIEYLRTIVDLSSALMLGRPGSEIKRKEETLTEMLRGHDIWVNWSPTGDLEVPIHPPRQGKSKEYLHFRWFAKDDVAIVGYFLSGMANFQTNAHNGQKAEKCLKEGLRRLEQPLDKNGPTPHSLPAAGARIQYRKLLRCFMLLYLAFLFAVRTDWDEAIKSLQILHDCIDRLPNRQEAPPMLEKLVLYLTGTIHQGIGDLSQALAYYQNLLNDPSEIGLVATINTVIILRGSDHCDDRRADSLLRTIERACSETKNALVKAAFCCVKGTERGELIKSKKFLATGLQMAQQLFNQQIMFVVLSFMCQRFFSGVVSEQAEKSARAAWVNSKKGRDNLWSLVSGRMLQDCLRRQGHDLDEEDQRILNGSWEAVQRNFDRPENEDGI
ncbi:cohesin loading factor-domain-containing protein [Tirmania nivea]|nr:cohesin loading factor-domain-containing protein [Tirmania nivea]